MKHVINWGIIGLGNVAHQFAKSFYNIKNSKLIAIASKSQNKLSKFKAILDINENNCYDNYEKLLSNDEVDIVYIALPNSFHSKWILKSLDSKKHILVEKPAFTNLQDAEKSFNHPNFLSSFLGEGFMFRYHPQILKVVDLIRSKSIGKIISMESVFGKNLVTKKRFFGLFNSNRFDKRKRIFSKSLGGGAILDHGSYTVSMSLLIASLIDDLNIEKFDLVKNKNKSMIDEIDIESSIRLIFDKKFKSNITASFKNELGCLTNIKGENGVISIINSWNSEIGEVILKNNKEKVFKIQNNQNLYSTEIEKISSDILGNKTEASFPGTKKNEILIGTKILQSWLNA